MTTEAGILTVVEALGLPPEARVDARVPKKLLVEQGAPTSADKRAIQDGIDELQWLAACKPGTVGVPGFSDDTREYLEVAIIACAFRPGAKAARLIELIHRAIPYPVLLTSSDAEGVTISVAHKRHAEREAAKVVVERVVSTERLDPERPSPVEGAFLDNLFLARQPRADLFRLYDGWLACLEALNAARISGTFSILANAGSIEDRRAALETYQRISREIVSMRAQAGRERQMNRRVALNLEVQRLNVELQGAIRDL